MFSVYGPAGRLFRGSMEQLRQVGGVSAIARAISILPVGRDGVDAASSSPGVFALHAQQAAMPSDEAHRSALAAYAESQKVIPERHPLQQVDSLMSRTVITIPDTATVLQAWQILARHGVGQAPVLNKNAMLVGLLSRADLLRPERLPQPDSHALVWRALLAQNVANIMATPVPGVAPDTDIRRVARVLLDTGLPGLPVMDEPGLVIGFVSRSDILRAVVTDPPLDLWG
jgi:CBS-domain-containing membrane protein